MKPEEILIDRTRRVFFLFALCALFACSQPVPYGTYSQPVNVLADPVQEDVRRAAPIHMKVKRGEFTIMPVAQYRLSGIIVGKKRYWMDGWRTALAPYDLAIVWGDMARTEKRQYVSFTQSGRWYYYNWTSEAPFGEDVIIKHSSNNHILPANKNVLAAVDYLKEGQRVILEGFLVRVAGKYNGLEYWWNTSLSRDDTGDGSCEVFYVKKVIVKGGEYQ